MAKKLINTDVKLGTGTLLKESISEHYPDSDWINATLLNGWVNYLSGYPQISYRKIGNVVYLRGLAKSGIMGQKMFDLPVGYRPLTNTLFPIVSDLKYAMCDVYLDGSVTPSQGTVSIFVSLNGISFLVD